MATETTYNGDSNRTTFPITFPYLTHADIKVSVGGQTKTVDSDYTISGDTVTFGTAPTTGTANVKLYRTTDIDNPEHEYTAGSSITAAKLNENQRQALYAIEEAKLVTTTSGGITTGEKNDIHVNSDTDWVIRTDAVEQSMLADNSVGIDQIAPNSVNGDELVDNVVIPDANSIRFGTDSDMTIYHNGTSGVITNTTGDLYLWGNGSNNVDIRAKNDEHSIVCKPNAETELYYNNSLKLKTGNLGIYATGVTHSSEGYVFGGTSSYWYESASNQPTLRLGTTGPYLWFKNVVVNGDPNVKIESANGDLILDSASGTTTVSDNLSVSGTVSFTGPVYPVPASGSWWGHVPYINTDGVTEIGSIIDFHTANTNTADWDLRIAGITNPHRATNGTEVVLGYKTAGDWGQFLRNEQRNCHNFRWVQSGGSDWFEVVCDDAGAGGSNGANQVRGIEDYASDINLKENIIDSTYDALGCIKNIKLRSFDWNTAKSGRNGNVKCGVIAQEIETVNSDLVTTLTDGSKTLKPSQIITVSLKAIQDLISKVETLETKVAALEAQ